MSDYTQAATTAKNLMALFSGDTAITFFTVAVDATTVDIGVAHGLSGTPDFVLLSSNNTDDAAGTETGLGWTANATTLTITQDTTGTAQTVSVIAGNLS